MTYDENGLLIWTDSLGVEHIERHPTASMAIIRAEELEAQGHQVQL